MTLGLLFGSFDPIHNGHLDMIEQAQQEAGCDEVWLIVQSFNAYKTSLPFASLPHRAAMVKLAIASIPLANLVKLDREIQVMHSVTATLKELKRLDNKRQLVLILGRDLVDSFPQWDDYDEILQLSRLFEVERDLDDVSSGKIRHMIAQGQPIDGLVPMSVAEYIFEHGLYR